MKKKIFTLLTVCSIVLSAFSVGFADTKKKDNSSSQLLALLPPSDAVATINAKRLFGEALPQILSGNQPLLTEMSDKFDEIKSKTGIDLKQFEQIAVGVKATEVSATQYSLEPLLLARGQYSAAGLVAIAKIAANGKYREEKIGEHTIYVFSFKEMLEKNKAKVTNSMAVKIFDKLLAGLNNEMALTVYDNNTLAFGSVARLHEVFESKNKVFGEVLGAVTRKPDAIINFAAKLPNGLSQFLDLDNDELGKNLDAIRLLSGSMDVTTLGTSVSFSAKTVNAQQAKGLKDTLDGLQGFGKAIFGGAKNPDKKVYAKMVENAKIGLAGNEITLDLLVPQTDLDVIIGAKK